MNNEEKIIKVAGIAGAVFSVLGGIAAALGGVFSAKKEISELKGDKEG